MQLLQERMLAIASDTGADCVWLPGRMVLLLAPPQCNHALQRGKALEALLLPALPRL